MKMFGILVNAVLIFLILISVIKAPVGKTVTHGAILDERDEMLRKMDEKSPYYGKLSRQIWEYAEVGYKEMKSSQLLKSERKRLSVN